MGAFAGTDGLADLKWSGTTMTTIAFVALAAWLCWLVFAALPRLSIKDT